MVSELPTSSSWRDLKAPVLLFVHTTWCGYSRRARPIMDDVARSLGSTVPVVAVDADKHPDIAKALGVKSFPTIIFYNDTGLHQFKGERRVDTIVGHVCNHSSTGTYYNFCKNPLA